MAQTKARPPTFVLFSTRAEQLPESYRRYLINSLRESFDLPGVPLRVTMRSSRNPYADGEEKSGERREYAKPAPGKTGRVAKARTDAAAKAEAGAAAKPKGKPRTKKVKAGAPRGRAQKLNRPGTKPKRASRPSSTHRKPR
jgi:GTP-binding protein